MRNLRRLLRLLFVVLLTVPAVHARTIHVNGAAGDDTRDGLSPETALRTLAKAAPLLQPGDTLSLAPGLYHEALILRTSGTPTQPITIEGNGAVLSGRRPVPHDSWQPLPGGLFLSPNAVLVGASRPQVLDRHGNRIDRPGAKPEQLLPGQAIWTPKGILYRPEPGHTPQQDSLHGFYLLSGLAIINQSYLTVSNLICENFANDGFNVHGACRGLFFRNITARHNGDDGFSVHEDVQATVHGGHFHHNDFGIQDINIARSSYLGLLIEHNRIIGADFAGGFHSLEDSLVRDNAKGQLRLVRNQADHIGIRRDAPLLTATAYLRNVLVTGGPADALLLGVGCHATAVCCSFLETDTGVRLEPNASLHLLRSVIAHVRGNAIVASGAKLVVDSSSIHPAQGLVDGQPVREERLLAALDVRNGSLQPPQFRDRYRAARPRLPFLNQFAAPGFNPPCDLPFVPATPQRYALSDADAHAGYRFDFETFNPWSRTFIEPASRETAARHASTLSTDCAVSGKSSAHISLELPPAPKTRKVLLKLFTVQLRDLHRPPSRWTFQLRPGDGAQGAHFVMRIRDAKGKHFYGPSGTLDWQGWRQLDWDLGKLPPRNVDGSSIDTPPLELVLEVTFDVPPAGRHLHFYVDDLTLD